MVKNKINARSYDSSYDSENTFSVYLNNISKYNLLTPAEEIEISENIINSKNKLNIFNKKLSNGEISFKEHYNETKIVENEIRILKDRMIESNLRLVVSIAKKYQHRGISLTDLINEGNIGLIDSIDRYDHNKGCRISTYATWWIKQAILKSIADKGKSIRIPIHMQHTINNCSSVIKYLTEELNRTPTNNEISEYLNVSPEKVNDILNLTLEATSLDIFVDDENSTTLSDMVKDTKNDDPFESTYKKTFEDRIKDTLEILTQREKNIIKLRFGFDGQKSMTLEETGQLLGITRERVRQIQEKAKDKLRRTKLIREFEEFR